MLEIRFHGRGGQGTVVATILLAKAFFQAGYYVQSFPLFGVERRGAPVEAYLRLNQKKILARTNVYTPDHVVVLDRTLLQGVNVTRGAKPGGWILINSPSPAVVADAFAGYRLALVDATRIALAHGLGTRTHPIVNTAILGAFARVLAMPPMDAVAQAIREDVPSKPDENISAAQEAYDQVRLIGDSA
ncbi:MAG TPA: pyruvate ferredoxin oxidoreductase [Syntrophobacteraceae bacterium]|nr:pyruvate ferredoxin oxidoreductase [Syntrophobacteraceae bacterium]HBD08767.1 pyruvate ferredoxin oxidoreductase [Syntrophobacteraceae bacterium]HBZ54925.1 pyruvate ferredoxin oxidoreductase [Syntrophobacteraceae bacterium]